MRLRFIGLALLTLLLTACTKPDASSMLERYAQRVGTAIDEPVELDFEQALADRPALPPRRKRLIEIPPIREGLIDVLDFRHCNLLHAIAERNSSLGLMSGYSQRLIYELEMLPALRQCQQNIGQLDEDVPTRLKQRLAEVIKLKEQSLAALIWDALYTSEEMEQQFALGQPPLPLGPEQNPLTPLQGVMKRFLALAELSRNDDWVTPNFAPHLESDFETLYRSTFGAQWLTSLALLTHTLERSADALERRLARRPVCFNNRPNNQARIIRNVFQTFYAGELQPYLSMVDRLGREWLDYHQQILAYLPVPAEARPYFLQQLSLNAPNSLWQRYLAARDRHTRSWQALLRQCGMMPGS